MSMLQSRPTLTASNAQQLKSAAFKQQLPRAVRSCPQVARCQAAPVESQQVSRRQVVQLCSIAGAFAILPQSAVAAAKGPPGFNAAKDTQDSYQFVYPFGWQEVSVDGTDVVYKDIIEPLESASVTISKTDKASITDFGNPLEVAQQLTNEVLTPRSQQAKVLGVNKREIDGRTYYEFEFATKANTYIRHALAVVTVGNGKFYTLTTGSNENRWSKMKERLVEVVKSFQVSERFTG
ncbi:TPA: Oxygen-evolving enhancer protein 2-3, chloroplastic [Trebouxia sp. C0006]